MTNSIKSKGGVLGLLALLAAAFLFSSAPYAYANHEDGHTSDLTRLPMSPSTQRTSRTQRKAPVSSLSALQAASP